jgi:hypothetical protein
MTFDGYSSNNIFLYEVGSYKNSGFYILGNTTITLPSLYISFGINYATGFGNNFTNNFTIGHVDWINYIFQVWFSIGGVSYGPYQYRWYLPSNGAVDLPMGGFNTNDPHIDQTFVIQLSYTDYNGNDLTTLLQSFNVGDKVYLTCCGTTPSWS